MPCTSTAEARSIRAAMRREQGRAEEIAMAS